MTKKQATILIFSIIFLIVGGLAAFYYFFLNGKPADVGINTPPTTTPTTPNRPTTPRPGGIIQTPTATTTASTTPDTATTTDAVIEIPRLRKLSEGYVAGYISYTEKKTENKKTFDETVVRFAEKSNSKISEARGTSLAINKIAPIQVPPGKLGEVVWNKNGKSFFARYVNDAEEIETVYSELITAKKIATTTDIVQLPYDVKNSFLPKEIAFLVTLENKTSIFFGINGVNGIQTYNAKTDGTQRKLIWSYPLKEWQVQNPREGSIQLTSKPSAGIFGYSYSLNTSSGVLTRIFGDIKGLTTLAQPKGSLILLSGSITGSFDASLFDTGTGKFNRFPLSVLSEKCTWAKKSSAIIYCAVSKTIPREQYPDAWYQGLVSFQDEIWKIDTEKGSTQTFFIPNKEAGEEMDIINLSVTDADRELLFQNKKDGVLWILRLDENLLPL